jgi:hypothetical protein
MDEKMPGDRFIETLQAAERRRRRQLPRPEGRGFTGQLMKTPSATPSDVNYPGLKAGAC